MKIFLLGLPGAGKGTQGSLLSKYYGIPHISLGDRARQLANDSQSSLGREIRKIHEYQKWCPLPDFLAYQIFREAVSQIDDFIVDGFPRNEKQYDLLDIDDVCFLHLDIPESVSRDRVMIRNRSDNVMNFWKSRIATERIRLPLLLDKISAISINGTQSPDKIFKEIQWIIDSEWDNPLVQSLVNTVM